MLNFTYNYLIIYFLLYLTIQTNKKFFKFNHYFFLFSLFFHLSLTLIYTNLLETGDWETYLWEAETKEFKLTFSSFLSSHFVITVIIFFSRIIFLSDVSVIFIFSLTSFFVITFFEFGKYFLRKLNAKLEYLSLILPKKNNFTRSE